MILNFLSPYVVKTTMFEIQKRDSDRILRERGWAIAVKLCIERLMLGARSGEINRKFQPNPPVKKLDRQNGHLKNNTR